ncbi:MAG: ABC transporter substrate-binding protein [Bacteroidales bacterium]|nr:ABC transporter substrate-binding protein [Bacteroidales bacterium]
MKRTRNTLRTLAATVVTLAAFAACHTPDNSGRMIFRYNESAGIATLDPAFAKDQAHIWVCSQLYGGLIELDSSLVPQPAIAKSWTVSADGLTYRFTLRDDVYFHRNALFGTTDSTRRVVASDFVYSFNRILDPAVASPGLWIFSEVAEGGFAAPDDTTFVVTLRRPFAPFISLLGMQYCSVVPHEVADHYGADFRRNPCGTGPFRFQMWKEGVKLVLRRNDLYFQHDEEGRRLPLLDAVAVTFIVDKQTVFLEFVKGNLDFMNSLDASYKDELLNPDGSLRNKYADRLCMTSTPYLNTEYLGFNLDDADSPFADRRVRQALNYGFDRRKMMRYLRNNIGTPGVAGFVPPGLPGFDSAAYGYDYAPQRSAQLLAEAGYPEGKGLPQLKLSTTAGYLDLCKYIQQQLNLVGFDVKIDVNPPAALREQIAQSRVDWFRGSWVADYPDAENYLSLFVSDNFCPAGPNYTHFSSPAYDRLYRQAKAEPDPAVRTTLYRQLDSLAMAEAPVVVLYYDQILHFTHRNVSGLRSNAMNALDLRKVAISK